MSGQFERGDIVISSGKDSYFKGMFVCYLEKFAWEHPETGEMMGKGEIRCMVQGDHGILLTKDPANLRGVCRYGA